MLERERNEESRGAQKDCILIGCERAWGRVGAGQRGGLGSQLEHLEGVAWMALGVESSYLQDAWMPQEVWSSPLNHRNLKFAYTQLDMGKFHTEVCSVGGITENL